MTIKKDALLKTVLQLVFTGLAISFLFLLAKINAKSPDTPPVDFQKKDIVIKHQGITVKASLHFYDGEIKEIEGEVWILESQIVDPITFEPVFTFWTKENGSSSTYDAIFKILSESNRMEIENQISRKIDEQEQIIQHTK